MRTWTRISLAISSPLLALSLGATQFSMPMVDVSPNEAGANALYAVWSATSVSQAAGTLIAISFPASVSIPGSFDPTANNVFMKFMSSPNTWTPSEVTVTSASYSGSGGYVSLSLPAALYPGKFYVRFDITAGFTNPPNHGLATLAIVDPLGTTTVSQGFYYKPTYSAAVNLGIINGFVKDTNGKAITGALVMATDYGSFLPASISARMGWVEPMSVTNNALSTATGGDGSFSLSVPPGNYSVKAEVWRHKNGVAESQVTAVQTPTVAENGIETLTFTVNVMP